MKCRIFTTAAFVLLSSCLFSQIVGGFKNGQSVPSKVDPSKVSEGGLSGDVNLFSGTYNASYLLGTVSCPSGLSYSVSLSYGSTFTSGDNLPSSSGIPYGEGWNVDVPTISISTEDFQKYSIIQKYQMSQGVDPEIPQYCEASRPEAWDEGKLFWFSPQLSIPGMASGRLVYKYYRDGKHIFVLHTFENYVEAQYDGGYWEVISSDGTRYEFGPVRRYHQPANQRIQDDCIDNIALRNLVLPKQEIMTWYCTRITNRDLVGQIHFDYEGFGKIDYFKAYKQSRLVEQYNDWFENHSAQTNPVPAPAPAVYQELFLKQISSESERISFEYESISQAGATNSLDFKTDPTVHRLDSLYSYKIVKNWGATGNDFSTWSRYKHIKAIDNYDMISETNPYIGQNKVPTLGPPAYYREDIPQGQNKPAFSHGFLESERIHTESSEIVPGDIYELRTFIFSDDVQAGKAALFDINLATGDNVNPVYPAGTGPQLGPEEVLASQYQRNRGEAVYSTFNRAIKWFTYDLAEQNVTTATSDYFVMPNLPLDYQGFHIQVGPANSDNNFSLDPIGISTPTPPFDMPYVCRSYFQTLDPDDVGGYALKSSDPIPNNFGVGLPWFMMGDFYGGIDEALQYCKPGWGDPGSGILNFWWNDEEEYPLYSWENQPTKTEWANGANPPDRVYLDSVHLIRYAKNPYMLKAVKKYVFNGGYELPEDPINEVWRPVMHLGFEYDLMTVGSSVTYWPSEGAIMQSQQTSNSRCIYLLKKIRQLPHNTMSPSQGDIDGAPTTHFEYDNSYVLSNMEPFSINMAPVLPGNSSFYTLNSSYALLTSVVNPLGKETSIEYYKLDEANTKSYSIAKFSYRPRPGEFLEDGRVKQAYPYAYQTYMVVKQKTVVDNTGTKCWKYTFTNPATKNDQVFLTPNFAYDYLFNYSHGFSVTTVHGPAAGCGMGPKNVYYHHTDDKLFGKLYKAETFDEENKMISRSESEYDYILAFESAIHRVNMDMQHQRYDYFEYHHATEFDRPLIEGYSDINQYIDALYNGFIAAYSSNQEWHQYILTTPPPESPVFTCEENGTQYPCNCYDYYDELTINQQGLCDSYFDSYQVWLENAPSQGPFNMALEYAPPTFYEAAFAYEIDQNNPEYLSSYFIRKKSDTQTTFDTKCEFVQKEGGAG